MHHEHSIVLVSVFEYMPAVHVLGSVVCLPQVQPSNVACLAVGGTSCWLNYESKPFYTLLVRVTDSGSPPLSTDFYLNVTLKNVNDRPRQIKLSDFRLYENQPVGTVVGKFSGYDEDAHQQLTFVLDNDDKGR